MGLMLQDVTEPLVSIVLPTFNRAHCLGRAIESVFNQTYTNWELIIVDNHSLDGSDQLVSQYKDSRIKYIKVHNQGIIAVSRNIGINHSSGKYVAFLDSDDWWAVEKLQKSIHHLEAGADFVYHDLYLVRGTTTRIRCWSRARTRTLKSSVFENLLFFGNGINNSSVVTKLELMKKIQGFSVDPNLVTAEDYEAWLKIGKISNAFFRIDSVLGFYTVDQSNSSAPQKTITSWKSIKKEYLLSIPRFGRLNRFPSYLFSMGKAYFILGNYQRSKIFFLSVLQQNLSIFIKIKAVLWLAKVVIKN